MSEDATQPLVDPRSSAPPLDVIARVLDAPSKPEAIRLGGAPCVVGSAPNCDVVVASPTVSRSHVELVLVPEGVSVRDLGSRNGTFFHGERIEKMVLAPGGRLRIGGVTLALDADLDAIHGGPPSPDGAYRGIVGSSAAMRSLFAALRRLEGSLVTVLVEGESGVGKERVTQALHDGSAVGSGPLVAINCGAIPRELVASELFGHRRGAFSGAFDTRRGAFETADGGTLFLDEIGELPLDVQPMLLRAIELGEIRPLGDDRAKKVRVRVVAATNRDLSEEVQLGTFRQDLFYRLAVVRLRVPPLRERPEDIEPLARHFARQARLADLPSAVLDELRSRYWQGNARELQNAVLAYAALGAIPRPAQVAPALVHDAVAPLVDLGRAYADQKDELTEEFTRAYLGALMQHTRGNQSEAARVSGLSRTYLLKLLAKHGLLKSGNH